MVVSQLGKMWKKTRVFAKKSANSKVKSMKCGSLPFPQTRYKQEDYLKQIES